MTTLTLECEQGPGDGLEVVTYDDGTITIEAEYPVVLVLERRRSIQALRDLLDQHLAATTCSTCDGSGRVDDLLDVSRPCPDCTP